MVRCGGRCVAWKASASKTNVLRRPSRVWPRRGPGIRRRRGRCSKARLLFIENLLGFRADMSDSRAADFIQQLSRARVNVDKFDELGKIPNSRALKFCLPWFSCSRALPVGGAHHRLLPGGRLGCVGGSGQGCTPSARSSADRPDLEKYRAFVYHSPAWRRFLCCPGLKSHHWGIV